MFRWETKKQRNHHTAQQQSTVSPQHVFEPSTQLDSSVPPPPLISPDRSPFIESESVVQPSQKNRPQKVNHNRGDGRPRLYLEIEINHI